MNIISLRTVDRFCKKHSNAKESLRSLMKSLEKSSFKNANEITETYKRSSKLKNNRILFRVKGNFYRVIIIFDFKKQKGFIRFIGTHSEYDKIDANTV